MGERARRQSIDKAPAYTARANCDRRLLRQRERAVQYVSCELNYNNRAKVPGGRHLLRKWRENKKKEVWRRCKKTHARRAGASVGEGGGN